MLGQEVGVQLPSKLYKTNRNGSELKNNNNNIPDRSNRIC
jgi:hypothetical protein